jgi:hypothetical protein
MIEISRDNYELYVLDYIEGNLPMDIHIKFEVFLSQNKDIEEELSALPDFTPDVSERLEQEDILSLKKGELQAASITKENCDFFFTAYHEGDLSEAEKIRVYEFIQSNPDVKDDFTQVGLLVFAHDSEVIFPFKKELKKAVPLSPFILLGRIAAIFILVVSIALAIFLPREKDPIYTARKVNLQFPAEKPTQLLFTAIEDVAIEPQTIEKKNTTKEKDVSNKRSPILIENDPQLIVENNSIEVGDEALAQSGNENLVSEENTIVIAEEEIIPEDAPVVSIPAKAEEILADENASETILKFKKPSFKKDKEDDNVYAASDETLIKIANPLKGKMKNGFSFGPIKVKRH